MLREPPNKDSLPAVRTVVLFNVQDDEQVARRPAVDTGLAFACYAQTRTGLDTGRDLDLKRFFFLDASLPTAFLARVSDDLALALAVRASPHYAEKALLVTRLAAARRR